MKSALRAWRSREARSHEEDPIHRRVDSNDPPEGRHEASSGGGEVARRQRPDDLQLAEALWQLGAVRCQTLSQPKQENGRLKKMVADRDLEVDCPQGDHEKQMVGTRVSRQPVVTCLAIFGPVDA